MSGESPHPQLQAVKMYICMSGSAQCIHHGLILFQSKPKKPSSRSAHLDDPGSVILARTPSQQKQSTAHYPASVRTLSQPIVISPHKVKSSRPPAAAAVPHEVSDQEVASSSASSSDSDSDSDGSDEEGRGWP